MKNLKTEIELKIKKKGYTKELIYSSIGMTKSGFDHSLKNETLKLKEFSMVVNMLNIEPNWFFDWNQKDDISTTNTANLEAKSKINDTKIDTGVSEVDFLRSQVEKLTKIIENLSSQIDSKNIN